MLIHSHSSLLHSFHLYNPSSLPPFPSSFCSPRPLPQSDIVHQSVYELVHSEDREELQRQLMWNSHLLPDQAQLTLQEALQADQTPLERNFTVRFRCLLDNTSGFLVSVLCYACFVSIFSGHVFFFYLLLDLSLSFFFFSFPALFLSCNVFFLLTLNAFPFYHLSFLFFLNPSPVFSLFCPFSFASDVVSFFFCYINLLHYLPLYFHFLLRSHLYRLYFLLSFSSSLSLLPFLLRHFAPHFYYFLLNTITVFLFFITIASFHLLFLLISTSCLSFSCSVLRRLRRKAEKALYHAV